MPTSLSAALAPKGKKTIERRNTTGKRQLCINRTSERDHCAGLEMIVRLSSRRDVIKKGRLTLVLQETTTAGHHVAPTGRICEQPANEFVAAFVGQSNLLSGRVLQAKEGLIEVRTDDNVPRITAVRLPVLVLARNRPGQSYSWLET
jgi:hypothetical protein